MSRNPYVREISRTTWYLGRKRDFLHMAQEVTSLFIGIYTLLLLWGVKALSQGPETYQAFLDGLTSPLSIAFHWVALAFTLYHAVAWFAVTPKAMPVQMGEEFLPEWIIAAGHYVAWIVVSIVILYLAGGIGG
ncbi:MAG: fumarate reductase subunit C [Gammaproteobacteria bacterium]|nr:fumarate reductase subunit C [Gammaproteobacteria bacterium]